MSSILLLAAASSASSVQGRVDTASYKPLNNLHQLNSVDATVLCYKCLESTGDAHDNAGGNCHMPDKDTETVAKESDGDSGAGLCTTITGIIMNEGDKVDAPTGDLIYTRRDTSGKEK